MGREGSGSDSGDRGQLKKGLNVKGEIRSNRFRRRELDHWGISSTEDVGQRALSTKSVNEKIRTRTLKREPRYKEPPTEARHSGFTGGSMASTKESSKRLHGRRGRLTVETYIKIRRPNNGVSPK